MSTEAFARAAIAGGLPLRIDGRYHPPADRALATITSGEHMSRADYFCHSC